MKYLLSLFIIGCGYYTLTFGISMWKEEKNKLGGFGAVSLAVITATVPILVMFLRG